MKPIVIAGNGPSLAQIDYSRLPQDFDVFRCNQFYFEDKYFLGKKIKGVFFTHSLLKEQFFTLYHIEKKCEYEVENVYCRIDYEKKLSFSSIETTYSYIKQMKKFHQLLDFYQMFFHKHFTSGIHMLIVAIAQGYKEIYLTGIDFYRGGGQTMFLALILKVIFVQEFLILTTQILIATIQKNLIWRQLDSHFLCLVLNFMPLAQILHYVKFCPLLQSKIINLLRF